MCGAMWDGKQPGGPIMSAAESGRFETLGEERKVSQEFAHFYSR